MSIFVYFDEHTFKVAKVTRNDHLAGSYREKTAERFRPEEAAARERSTAHPKRYHEFPGKPV